ncbi:MAG: carboxylating nicotinate-nucleotide diphosphorylase [Candidatus Cloacimonadia bacterium]
MGKLDTKEIIKYSLAEDVGTGDITTDNLNISHKIADAVILAKQDCIIAGIDVAIRVFNTVDPDIQSTKRNSDGDYVEKDARVLLLRGSISSLLKAERVALNFLQRLSGIATLTRKFVEATKGTNAKILDTRKTTPLLRELEKYAVRMGGGYNHRMGLYDAVLIKDNHITAVGSITQAVKTIRDALPNTFVEVEVKNLEELQEAIDNKVDRIMLDNMNPETIRKAVKITNKKVELEVSGGINLENVKEVAATGVDYISVGAITHSYQSCDFSLLVEG